MEGVGNLDTVFLAMADPTRRAILARLAKGEATVMELAEPFAMSQPAVSQHLKVLEGAGLVLSRVDGARRPRRLAPGGIETMEQWLAMLRKGLEKSYDRLDMLLASMEEPKKKKGEK
jgi:DNA-binding transcriptional ArsR family regulator